MTAVRAQLGLFLTKVVVVVLVLGYEWKKGLKMGKKIVKTNTGTEDKTKGRSRSGLSRAERETGGDS